MKITSISQISRIGREWAESVKHNPLRKGVSRFVTIATDDLTETLGKTADGVVVLERKAKNGASELTIKDPEIKGIFKKLVFPDGSGCEVRLINGEPRRTNGYFFLNKKSGEKVACEYGLDGYSSPETQKDIFKINLDRFGKPEYEVDFSPLFSDGKPTLKQKIKNLFRPIINIFKKYNTENTSWRKFANSIDRNA